MTRTCRKITKLSYPKNLSASAAKDRTSTKELNSAFLVVIVPKKRFRGGSDRRQKKEDATNDIAMSESWTKGLKW